MARGIRQRRRVHVRLRRRGGVDRRRPGERRPARRAVPGTVRRQGGVPQVLACCRSTASARRSSSPRATPSATPTGCARSPTAGHEIAHHGYTHTSPTLLTREEEEEELTKGLRSSASSARTSSGYRSPAWDFSANTLELLEKHGFRYSSNFMDDLVPYRHEGTSIVELPVQWTLADAAHFWFDGVELDQDDRHRQRGEGDLVGRVPGHPASSAAAACSRCTRR